MSARTVAQLAAEAVQVQDACNLVAVASGMARALSDLRAHVRGDDELRAHPVARAWADKIASLTGIQLDPAAASYAHANCLLLSMPKTEPQAVRHAWNTGRRYTSKGQRIGAIYTPEDDRIYFVDIDRMIDGVIQAAFPINSGKDLHEATMLAYDHNRYEWTARLADFLPEITTAAHGVRA